MDECTSYRVKLHARHGGRKLFDANPGVAKHAILLTDTGPVLVKNQRIGQWKYDGIWPARHQVIERYDLVRTNKGDIGIVTSFRRGFWNNFRLSSPPEVRGLPGGHVKIIRRDDLCGRHS